MDKVLIVDDNKSMLNKLQDYLARYRYEFEILTAVDGQKAMEMLEGTDIDLVITDLVMPKMDGFTLLAHINEQYPRILCIAMSGYATDHMVNMLPDNLLQFVRKPFKIYELIEIIRKSLKEKPPGGTVGGISIASFMQLIEMEEKSCALEVSLPDNKKGSFLYKEGVLYDAFYENLTGEKAAIEIIQHDEKVRFTLNPLPNRNLPRRINSRVMELRLQASRIRDQGEEGGS